VQPRFIQGASILTQNRSLKSSLHNANLLKIILRAAICYRSRAYARIQTRGVHLLFSCIWIVRSYETLSSACRTPGSLKSPAGSRAYARTICNQLLSFFNLSCLTCLRKSELSYCAANRFDLIASGSGPRDNRLNPTCCCLGPQLLKTA
jgi:hypothetical protein